MFEFEIPQLSETVGMVGVLTYLASYFALQAGFIRGQTYTYATLNIVAASCVLFDLQTHFNLSSALIQASWILISMVGIARLYYIANHIKLNREEAEFVASKLPGLPKNLARKLLDQGYWAEIQAGTIVAHEGKPVRELLYMAEGEAQISFGGHLIFQNYNDNFIGEVTCLSGDPATATVTITSPSRCFCIGAEPLRQLARRNSELRQVLEASFALDVRKKLLLTNQRQQTLAAETAGAPVTA